MVFFDWRARANRCHKVLLAWNTTHTGWIPGFVAIALLRTWLALLGLAALLTGTQLTEWARFNGLYHDVEPIPPQGQGLLLAPWQRWDALWYERIARIGYSSDESTSFFPLFPVLMRRVATFLGGDFVLAGVIICTVAAFFAFVLLYRITAQVLDVYSAKRAVLYWAIFPTSYYLLGGYAESVMAACALATLYFAQRKIWWLTGIAAAGATLTRPVGFLVLVPVVIEVMQQAVGWSKRLRMILPSLLATTLAMGAWILYLQLALNDGLLWMHSEEAWKRVFVFPGQTILLTIQKIIEGQFLLPNIIDLVLTMIVFGAILTGIKKVPLSFSAYALVMLIVPMLNYAQSGTYASIPMAAGGRRAMVVFPAFISLGGLVRGRWLQPAWIAFSLSFQAVLFIEFVRWIWID